MSLIKHVENYLASIIEGQKDDNSEESFQIVSFNDCPADTVSTFLSLGMSENILKINTSKTVRQQLVFLAYTQDVEPKIVVSFLMSLCEAIIIRKKAVLRGELIPLRSDFAEKMGFEFVYCTIPAFFDDEFYCYDETSPSTVIVWIIPIYKTEANFIFKNGWECFEDLLEEKDPDLYSLKRQAVVLCG